MARGFAALAVLLWLASPRALAADPGGIAVSVAGGAETVLTMEALAAMPAVAVPFAAGHGGHAASFEGPLLWGVLDRTGVIDAAKPASQVRQSVLITGSDGYTAVLALGEISPAFEGKQVILAERMDGQALAPGHLRIVVPGDARGGRSVRDVARITVLQAAEARQ
jgi:DMSO/TMAO reductase YedYZ molybdopterin-dependent catalytic subunit